MQYISRRNNRFRSVTGAADQRSADSSHSRKEKRSGRRERIIT